MLTDEQREQMSRATAWFNSQGLDAEDPWPGCLPGEIVATRDTLADFAAAWGGADEVLATPEGVLHAWGFDGPEGEHALFLFVMDFGEFRAAAGDAIRRDRPEAQGTGVTALGMAIYIDAIGSRDEMLAGRLERKIAEEGERQEADEQRRRGEEEAQRRAADEAYHEYLDSLPDPEED